MEESKNFNNKLNTLIELLIDSPDFSVELIELYKLLHDPKIDLNKNSIKGLNKYDDYILLVKKVLYKQSKYNEIVKYIVNIKSDIGIRPKNNTLYLDYYYIVNLLTNIDEIIKYKSFSIELIDYINKSDKTIISLRNITFLYKLNNIIVLTDKLNNIVAGLKLLYKQFK